MLKIKWYMKCMGTYMKITKRKGGKMLMKKKEFLEINKMIKSQRKNELDKMAQRIILNKKDSINVKFAMNKSIIFNVLNLTNFRHKHI